MDFELTLVADNQTFNLPRILCLHGGGTNSRIFRAQCRKLIDQLKHEFRLVFAEAPFPSQAGPDVMSVYSHWGPFKRWLRWLPEHPEIRPEEVERQLNQSLENAMRQDDELGATGEWVALLGFSQGAKVSASLLYSQQTQNGISDTQNTSPKYRFGILLAGRAPFVSLGPHKILNLPDASQITDVKGFRRSTLWDKGHVLSIPTVHVHGMRDPGLDLHRQLFEDCCHPDSRRLVEWDGDHRVARKRHDVLLVAQEIRLLAKTTGIY